MESGYRNYISEYTIYRGILIELKYTPGILCASVSVCMCFMYVMYVMTFPWTAPFLSQYRENNSSPQPVDTLWYAFSIALVGYTERKKSESI